MKRFTLFELAIIGFFVGILIAAYIVFLAGTGGFLGGILSSISLLPVLKMLAIPALDNLVATFVFVVLVYMVYTVIVGSIIQKANKLSIAAALLVLVFPISVYLQQKQGSQAMAHDMADTVAAVALANNAQIETQQASASIGSEIEGLIATSSTTTIAFRNGLAATSTPTGAASSSAMIANGAALSGMPQYFGKEARGDLNGDGKEDIAFLIPRNDDGKDPIYYMAAALAGEKGYVGTNLIFLGSKVEPKELTIGRGAATLLYMDRTNKTATSTKTLYAEVKDGVLKQIKSLVEDGSMAP